MNVLVSVSAALIVGLAAYSLGHYLCALLCVLVARRRRVFTDSPLTPVSVLVPARNEGERALRVITSLLRQDHAGPIDVYLLLKDRTDSALACLEAFFPDADFGGEAETVEWSTEVEGRPRRVVVAFTGSDPKSDKINWVVPRIGTELSAILDCDHQARPDWIRSSLCLLTEQNARIIQCRRDPISARGFFSLWDSLHQHIGCELFNAAFTRLGLTVFFTGTTAVMETSLLRQHPFGACITEDIDFSYNILFQGVKIIENPFSGSSEETSPDLYSFLARRRRWSNGHTSTFFKHLFRKREAKVSLRGRLQFVYHGAHYLVSLGVFFLHLLIGLLFIRTFSSSSQVAAVMSSVVLAYLIARTQRTIGILGRLSEILVVFAWLFPAVVIAMNLIQALLLNDFSRAALPISHLVEAVGLVGLAAPVVVLLLGLLAFRQLGAGTFFAVVLTYPFAFYLDISGVLLGMADWLTGGARWRAVSRSAPVAADPAKANGELLPTLHLRESYSLRSLFLGSSSGRERGSWLGKRLRFVLRPSRSIPGLLIIAFFCGGAMFAPSTQIKVKPGHCEAMEHDGEPWIVPAKRLTGYCAASETERTEPGQRTGTFHSVREDDLKTIDPTFWDSLDTTFFCNQAIFSPGNVLPKNENGALSLEVRHEKGGDREFTAGSIATKDVPDARFTYGRFEAVLKPNKTSGIITAFFLYRFDPWQEIDTEFVGKDTTKILLNVYYNPGEEGDLYNYGLLGTPVMVDLGFDASESFHKYAIEWEADQIRWFVDDQLIHVRRAGVPTPIPHLPMRFYINNWPCCSEKLAGAFRQGDETTRAEFKSVSISRWYPSPLPRFLSRFDSLFASRDSSDWRKNAKWMQPPQ